MEIKEPNKPTSVEFSTIELGTVFVPPLGEYYMKTEAINTVYCNQYREDYNAVNLYTGIMVHFDDNEPVRIVDCELVVH